MEWLAVAAAGTVDKVYPPTWVVVVTGLVLVFFILVLLFVILLIMGKIFTTIDKRKENAKKQEVDNTAKQAPVLSPAAQVPPMPVAQAVPQPLPVIEEGIPPEVVAAIAAAVATIEDERYSLQSVKAVPKGRGQWGLAGVISYTEPF